METKRSRRDVREEENVVHILLKCNASKRWGAKNLDNKWQYISEKMARKKKISCNKITEF